jgi:hypothetical protein
MKTLIIVALVILVSSVTVSTFAFVVLGVLLSMVGGYH